MEKYNAATVMGWRVLRYTPQQFRQFLHLKDINEIIENEKNTKG